MENNIPFQPELHMLYLIIYFFKYNNMLYEHNHGYQLLFKETIQHQQKTTLLLNIKLIHPWSLLENAVSPYITFIKAEHALKIFTLHFIKF